MTDYLSATEFDWHGECIKNIRWMMKEINIRLHCCGAIRKVEINQRAILAQEPNEIRKNINCHVCDKLVILDFKNGDGAEIEQEVINLGNSQRF